MARDQRDEKEELAVEVAKLKVRVAAEKAEPSRLLRQGVRSAPLSTVAGAIGVGALLAVLGRRRARPAAMADMAERMGLDSLGLDRLDRDGANARSSLGALAVAVALEVARRRFPQLFERGGATR